MAPVVSFIPKWSLLQSIGFSTRPYDALSAAPEIVHFCQSTPPYDHHQHSVHSDLPKFSLVSNPLALQFAPPS